MEIIIDTEELIKLNLLDAKKVREVARAEFQDAGRQMINFIKIGMNKSKGGRKYKRGGVIHEASKKGNMPSIDLAGLVRSLFYKTAPDASSILLKSTVGYSGALEYGKLDRPFFRPAADERAPKILKNIIDELRKQAFA